VHGGNNADSWRYRWSHQQLGRLGRQSVKLLLDTHIWLWSTLQPEKISPRVAKALTNQENELWLSPISVWELNLLHGKGRVKAPDGVPRWVASSVEELRLTEAPLTIEVALAVSALDLPHGDPADHFLVALITADRNLIHAPGLSVMAN